MQRVLKMIVRFTFKYLHVAYYCGLKIAADINVLAAIGPLSWRFV